MADPRRHHILAQLYQRGFANERDQVRVIERATGRCYVSNMANVFAEKDFNAFRDEDGELRQDVEKLLANHVDSPATSGLQALRDGVFPLSDDQREGVARFMAAQLTRGRHFRETTSEAMEKVGAMMLRVAAQYYTDDHWLRAVGYVPSPKEIEALARQDDFDIVPSQGPLLGAMLDSIDDMTEHLFRRIWTLVCFSEPYLFTSEEPVIFSGSGGIVTADEIRLVVCPTGILLLTLPGAGLEENVLQGHRENAEYINAQTLEWPPSRHLLLAPTVTAHPLPSDFSCADCAYLALTELRGQ